MLVQVEIEVNGAPIDLTMNIDETGKVFYARTRQVSVVHAVTLTTPFPLIGCGEGPC